jgi:hypothetical protein
VWALSRARMTSPEHRFTGRDVTGAGLLMLAVNLAVTGVGAAVGTLVGALVPLAITGFAVGFFLGIGVVVKRFRDL